MLTKPKAILFDWDNTLVDTWPTIHEALRVTFEAMGHEPWTMEMVQERVHRSMRDAFPELFGKLAEEAAETYQASFRAIHLERLTALKGAVETLELLKPKEWFIGVVSNKKGVNLRKEIEHISWGRYFDAIVGADDATNDKPHPDSVHMALEGSDIIDMQDIWFVGDSITDLECAQNVGCQMILYGDHTTEAAIGGGMGSYRGVDFHAHARNHQEMRSFIDTILD
jgi:phosphoglycolate phosphatase